MEFSPKRPDENEIFSHNFTPLLGTGETIVTSTVSCSVLEGVDSSASTMPSGSTIISGGKVSQYIQAGVNGVRYEILFSITTSTGQTIKETVELLVRYTGG